MTATNCLPKTIEGAAARYLYNYETLFRGPKDEMRRLKRLAEASIIHLRRKVPKFYEDHLPKLVNQAASTLLSCETSTPSGSLKFHETHKLFLRVLDELKKSQPAGNVDFQDEVQRVKERDQLLTRHLYIRDKISSLEATELDCDEIGTDDADTKYNKIFTDLDKLKKELKTVSVLIAELEGERVDQHAEFKLQVPQGSTLERLSADQVKHLESQIVDYLKQHDQKKKSMYVNKSIIDGMIAKLDIDPTKFTLVEMNDLSKDALDAYKLHYRNIENERRDEFYESLLRNKYLRPKEGLILEGPDDVPDDVKQQLDQSNRRYKRKLDECFEEFAKRQPELVDENASADAVEDDDDSSNDGADIQRIIEENGHLFKRVKEEPRDDYENEAPSDSELIVSSDIADDIEELQNGHSPRHGNASSTRYSTPERQSHGSSSSPDSSAAGTSYESQIELATQNGSAQSQKDEFEVLGLVEPSDKIPVIEIDDD